MRLITEKGELELPKELSITLKRTNPLLSDEGDTSYPMALPSTPRNLALLGHLERIDRASRYMNKTEAILEVGPVRKSGELVIDTVRRRGGISAVFAIDNSEAYVKAKDKTLREIFEGYNNGAGYKESFLSIEAAVNVMQEVYTGKISRDYMIFPVAVSPYEEGDDDNKVKVYQYNNEDDGSGNLVYEERVVREGDIHMAVPKGYGIAPFMKLSSLLRIMFYILDYTVTENCFDDQPIVIVHNCSDCLVKPELRFADLVPSCKLSEFLEWLLHKFHAQPVVDSQNKTVQFVLMEDMLSASLPDADSDITAMVVDDWEVQLSTSKRVVLRPSNEIEGTEPAAETFLDLLEKYGYYVNANENQWESLTGENPAFTDCLVLRAATGVFFLLERDVASGEQVINRLGTNYFCYDRRNSAETEEFSQIDINPLMLCEKKAVTPFVGSRCHRHTSYNGKNEDAEQKIIAVLAATNGNFVFPTTGTTQQDIPYKTNGSYSFGYGMANEWLYATFWKRYNELLLNNAVRLKGRVKYNIGQFVGMNMSAMKMCKGRMFMPVSAEMEMGNKSGIADTEFMLGFTGGDNDAFDVTDSFIEAGQNTLKWMLDSTYIEARALEIFMEYIYLPGITFRGYSVEPIENRQLWIGTPKEVGETRQVTLLSNFIIKTTEYQQIQGYEFYHNREFRIDGHYDDHGNLLDNNGTPWTWLQEMVTYPFIAVAV